MIGPAAIHGVLAFVQEGPLATFFERFWHELPLLVGIVYSRWFTNQVALVRQPQRFGKLRIGCCKNIRLNTLEEGK